jgi:hypothetical protein
MQKKISLFKQGIQAIMKATEKDLKKTGEQFLN